MTKDKKENIGVTSKAEGIIKSLVNLVGVTAGIIIVSIGSIMFLESVFKIYIFGIDHGRYNSFAYRCDQFDIASVEARRLIGTNTNLTVDVAMLELPEKRLNSKDEKKQKQKRLTKEEVQFLQTKYKECKKEAKQEAKENFERGEKMDIAEGIAFMLVGFLLLYFYRRKRRIFKK